MLSPPAKVEMFEGVQGFPLHALLRDSLLPPDHSEAIGIAHHLTAVARRARRHVDDGFKGDLEQPLLSDGGKRKLPAGNPLADG